MRLRLTVVLRHPSSVPSSLRPVLSIPRLVHQLRLLPVKLISMSFSEDVKTRRPGDIKGHDPEHFIDVTVSHFAPFVHLTYFKLVQLIGHCH